MCGIFFLFGTFFKWRNVFIFKDNVIFILFNFVSIKLNIYGNQTHIQAQEKNKNKHGPIGQSYNKGNHNVKF